MGDIISIDTRKTFEGQENSSTTSPEETPQSILDSFMAEELEGLKDFVIVATKEDGSFSITTTPMMNHQLYYLLSLARQAIL